MKTTKVFLRAFWNNVDANSRKASRKSLLKHGLKWRFPYLIFLSPRQENAFMPHTLTHTKSTKNNNKSVKNMWFFTFNCQRFSFRFLWDRCKNLGMNERQVSECFGRRRDQIQWVPHVEMLNKFFHFFWDISPFFWFVLYFM